MVSLVQGNKALGMPRCLKNLEGVVDPDDIISRRMEDEQGSVQLAYRLLHMGLFKIVKELLFDFERSATNGHLGFAPGFDPLFCSGQCTQDVSGLGRSGYSHDGY